MSIISRRGVIGNHDPFVIGPSHRDSWHDFQNGELPCWLSLRLPAIPTCGGDVDRALVLSQLMYWFDRPRENGASRVLLDRLAADVGLSLQQTRRHVRRLIADELIRRDPGGWYRPAARLLQESPATWHSLSLHRAAPWMAGSITAGVVLQQICQWFRRGQYGRCKAQLQAGGHVVICKSVGALAGELLRRYQAKRAAGHGAPDVGALSST